MAVYKIVEAGADVLREKAKEVKEVNSSILKLLDNMADTMRDAAGLGLAAPQIGVSKRVIVAEVDDQLYELVNPVVLEKEGESIAEEGCLSIPDMAGEVVRAEKVHVRGLNRQGEPVSIQGDGLLARVLQHEMDHLEGVLFVDVAQRVYRNS